MTMLEATILVVAVAKMYLAWQLFRNARGMTRAMGRMKGAKLHQADVARVKARLLAEVAKQREVQA